MMKKILFILSIVLAIAGCTKKQASDEIILGFSPAENADTVEANGKVLTKLIFEKTGLHLKTFVSTDMGGLIEAMRSGWVDIAFLPSFSLVQAEKIADAKVLLKAVRKGHAFFYSAIITAKNYKSLQDLKGKTIAWVDPSSASGHIIPKSSLIDQGINPDTFFSKQIFAGGHDALVLAVANKTVDAGATFTDDKEGKASSWVAFIKDPKLRSSIHILYVSPPVPGDTVSTTNKFYATHKEVVDKVVTLLIELGQTEEGRKVLKDLYRIDSMVPAKSEDYEIIRRAARNLNIK